MLINNTMAVLILSFVFFDIAWAAPTISVMMAVFGLIFYWICFQLITGTKRSFIVTDFDTVDMVSKRLVQITATLFLFGTGHIYVALLVAPWQIIMLFADSLSTMVKYGLVEIKENDE